MGELHRVTQGSRGIFPDCFFVIGSNPDPRTSLVAILAQTLEDYQRLVDEWIRTVGVRYFSELTNTAILMEEVGELARLMARLFGEQSFKEGEGAEDFGAEDLGMEMADVLFVLICLANQTGVDLEKAMAASIAKKTKRDAARHARNSKLQ